MQIAKVTDASRTSTATWREKIAAVPREIPAEQKYKKRKYKSC
jgi:hypothetical protein